MINYSEFVKELSKSGFTIKEELTPHDCHLIHMTFGISGEAGELLDAIKKYVIYRKPLDLINVIEELGDLEFYLEGLRESLDLDRDDILAKNMQKLKKRYSKGSYSDEQAKLRLDKR